MCELLSFSYLMIQTKDDNLFIDDIRKCSAHAIWPRPLIFFVVVVLLSALNFANIFGPLVFEAL